MADIFEGLATEASSRRNETIAAPPVGEIAAALSRFDPQKQKGSDILADMAERFRLRFDKVLAARIAVAHIRQRAPALAASLSNAVEAAIS